MRMTLYGHLRFSNNHRRRVSRVETPFAATRRNAVIGVNLYKAPRPEPPHFLKSNALRAFEPPHFLSDAIYFLPTMKLSSTV